MGKIYIIENDINNYKYIGLTTRSIDIRWKEHLRRGSKGIDEAIQRYGKEHFSIKELEDCPDELLDEREKYWISYYNSFYQGYNLTPGGREENLITLPNKYNQVYELWLGGYGQKEIAQITKLNIETVHNYLLKNNITKEDIKDRFRKKVGESKSRKILQFDLQGNFIKEWPSIAEINRSKIAGRKAVRLCCQGKQKSAKGFIWKYKDEMEI